MKKIIALALAFMMLISIAPLNAAAQPSQLSAGFEQEGQITAGVMKLNFGIEGLKAQGTFAVAFRYDNTVLELVRHADSSPVSVTAPNEAVTPINNVFTKSSGVTEAYIGMASAGNYTEVVFEGTTTTAIDATSQKATLFSAFLKLKAGKTAADLNAHSILWGDPEDKILSGWAGDQFDTTPIGISDVPDVRPFRYYGVGNTPPRDAGLIQIGSYLTYTNSNVYDWLVSLNPSDDQTISENSYGYATSNQSVLITITNTSEDGAPPLEGLSITLSNNNFEISQALSATTIANDETATFKVALKTGLAVYNYSAKATIKSTTTGDKVLKEINFSQAVVKADQAAVALSSIAEAKTTNSITVGTATGGSGTGAYQYGMSTTNSAGGITWKASRTFTGLAAGTTYYFFAKRLGDSNFNESSPSASAAIEPQKENQSSAVSVTVSTKTYNSVTLNTATGGSGTGAYQYGMSTTNSAGGITWKASRTFTGLSAETDYYFFAVKRGDSRYEDNFSNGLLVKTLSTPWNITFGAISNATVTTEARVAGAAVTSTQKGNTVTVLIDKTAPQNARFSGIEVKQGTNPVLVNLVEYGKQYTFTMPNGDVQINVTYELITEVYYTATITPQAGVVASVSKEIATAGENLSVYVPTVPTSKTVSKVIVTDASNTVITSTYNSTTRTATFTMPASNVTISVELKDVTGGGGGPGSSTPTEQPPQRTDGLFEITVPVGPADSKGDQKGTITDGKGQDVKDQMNKLPDATPIDIVIKVTDDEEGNLSITIPFALFEGAAQNNANSLYIQSKYINIAYNSIAIKAIYEKAAGSNVVISARRPNGELKVSNQKDGKIPASWDLSIVAGNKYISSFNGGISVINFPAPAPTMDQKPDNVVMFNVKADGTIIKILPNCHYSTVDKTITFSTRSYYESFGIGYNTVGFDDVKEADWFYSAINFAGARKIAQGYNGNVNPESNITRADFLILLMRTFEIDPSADYNMYNFSDAGKAYYTDYLGTAKYYGFILGTGENQFNPTRPITRQEMFTMVYRFINIDDRPLAKVNSNTIMNFGDGGNVSSYAVDPMNFLIQCGVLTGKSGSLLPADFTKRSETIQIVSDIIKKLDIKNYIRVK